MTPLVLIALLAAAPFGAGAAAGNKKPDLEKTESLIRQVVASGRVHAIGERSSERLTPRERLVPGAPPILAFRYIEGQKRHRFGDLDLVMDDAGH